MAAGTDTERTRAGGIQYVEKIAAIFSALRDHRTGLTVMEMSRITGLHKSTTSRLLVAMRNEDLIDLDRETRRYQIGPLIHSICAVAQPELTEILRQVVGPYLVKLNQETGETATLSVRDGYEVLTIDEKSGPYSLRHVAWTGMRTPLNASASGKCLLAHSSPEFVDYYLEHNQLKRLTPHTIVNKDELCQELRTTCERGYGYVNEELEEGLAALSMPLRNSDKEVLGVLNLSFPVFRVNDEKLEKFINLLRREAGEASRALWTIPATEPS